MLDAQAQFTDIYHEYIDLVYRIAFMLVKNAAEAEDISQSVFLRLVKNKEPYENHDHLKAWLIVTTQNCSKDFLKSSWNKKRIPIDKDIVSVDEQLASYELREKILSLPDKYKIPLYLYYFEGYKTKEISSILKIKHATVRTRLKTAKIKLKDYIEEE